MPVANMDILAPNYMGDSLGNSGIQGITANYGYGVAEATKTNEEAGESQKTTANPIMEKLRTAKAREFGLTKGTVGF